jgi:uncharacterized SAM-binding protein YcdF (DUF218 family)
MFLLSKLLPVFFLPLGFSLMLLTWGVLRKKRRPALFGLFILLLSSQPLVGRFLMRLAENGAERPGVQSFATGDAIVVLSVGRKTAPGPDHVSEWGEANRFFGGAELFRAGKAPVIVFTRAGGADAGGTEADILATVAMQMGISDAAILKTGPVLNTADEARETALVLRESGVVSPTVLLVTSAYHMTRAKSLFAREGLTVHPFPVDFTVAPAGRATLLDLLPSAEGLRHSHTALREFYGRAYYWLLDRF